MVLLFVSSLTFGHASAQADAESLIAALKQGGLVIYLRHAETEKEIPDKSPVDFDDCGTQRNLSAEGRAQARGLGAAIRSMGIPIAEVYSSPYCRCRETAELAFGSAEVLSELRFSVGLTLADRNRNADTLRRLLSEKVPGGGNRVIVSHTGNLMDAMEIWPKPEGVAWIFERDANGEIKPLGSLLAEDWLAQAGAQLN